MSAKTGPLAFVQKLKERAAKGDKLAIAELRKLRAIGIQQKRLMQAAALDRATDEAAEEIVRGAEQEAEAIEGEERVFQGDKLEQADFIAQKFNNADGLVQKVELRNHGWKGLADVAKFARINPPSVMQGVLGGYQIVNSTDVAPIQTVNWGGEDEETLPVTVTGFPVEQIANAATFGNGAASPYMILKWGTRAALAQAEIDIGKGMQLTVNASYVTAQVGVRRVLGVTGTMTMKLGAMLSFYPCVRTAPVTCTQVLDSTVSTTYAIPAFAKNFRFLVNDPPPATVEVAVLASNTNSLYTTTFTAAAPMTAPFPLTTDAVSLFIIPSANLGGRIIYELGI